MKRGINTCQNLNKKKLPGNVHYNLLHVLFIHVIIFYSKQK